MTPVEVFNPFVYRILWLEAMKAQNYRPQGMISPAIYENAIGCSHLFDEFGENCAPPEKSQVHQEAVRVRYLVGTPINSDTSFITKCFDEFSKTI
jgi:hypothetical protein